MSVVPQRLGKYAVTGVLGRGAMGIVYKGFDPDIKRTIALKTVSRGVGASDGDAAMIARRFRTEAEAAGRLAHPGIVNIFEYGEQGDVAYIAMEYVEGTSLREYFQRKVVFTEQDVISLMSQLLDALAHAHNQGVWHRDIKPANLLIASQGKLKLADFGVSRHRESELTQVGLVMGTPGYMPPERYVGLSTDHRGDLFAAGVVLYQLLANDMPFAAEADLTKYRTQEIQLTLPSVRQSARGWSHYDSVVQRALEREPDNRYQSAVEMRESLLQAYAQPAPPGIAPETVIRPSVTSGSALKSSEPGSSRGGVSGGAMSTARPTGWDESALNEIEKHLTRFIGPVAKVIVRRTARESTDVNHLLGKLADQLANPADRQAFVEATRRLGTATGSRPKVEAQPASGPMHTVANRAGMAPLSAELTERATKILTAYIGPIARVLAKRAAQESTVVAQFVEKLTAHIDEPAQREKFVRELGLKNNPKT